MMDLNALRWLQLFWVAMGLTYNAWSAWRIAQGQTGLAPTDPSIGTVFLAVSGAVIVAGMAGRAALYKFVLPVLALALGYGGVLVHALAFAGTAGGVSSGPAGYAGTWALVMALAINAYGLAVLMAGAWAAWLKSDEAR